MGYCERVYEFSGLIKNGELLQQLNDYLLLERTLIMDSGTYSAKWPVGETFEADTT
jgi:hypothetical protein